MEKGINLRSFAVRKEKNGVEARQDREVQRRFLADGNNPGEGEKSITQTRIYLYECSP